MGTSMCGGPPKVISVATQDFLPYFHRILRQLQKAKRPQETRSPKSLLHHNGMKPHSIGRAVVLACASRAHRGQRVAAGAQAAANVPARPAAPLRTKPRRRQGSGPVTRALRARARFLRPFGESAESSGLKSPGLLLPARRGLCPHALALQGKLAARSRS